MTVNIPQNWQLREGAAAIPKDCQQTKDSASVFVWPLGVDPATGWQFCAPGAGQQLDPADLPIEVLVAFARDCASRSPDRDATLIAMRDACGLGKLREAPRKRFPDALDRV